MITTTIKRPTKYEASRAIFSLLERGWSLTYPLTEIKVTGTERGAYNYMKSRYTSRTGTAQTLWVAQLKKEDAK